jgi:hypothetical protein
MAVLSDFDRERSSQGPVIHGQDWKLSMKPHLTRDRLYRSIAGAASMLVLCGIAIFAVSRHFAA